MSYKISLLFSTIFFALLFLLSVDVMCVQYHYSSLDTIAVAVGYEISSEGSTDEALLKQLEDKYNVKISNVSSNKPVYGDMVTYVVERDYKPIIISANLMKLRIQRATVIGYY